MSGKAYKVQIAFASTQSQVLQLQVHVPNTSGPISHIGGQVLPNAFKTFHFSVTVFPFCLSLSLHLSNIFC